ncbi:MAG: 3-hydroxyisobutyrate dehydrogenase [Gammaproteobacteria bacterium]|nr:MAG: 3-hydroxyisobutyrate dehydrogenase [Gammaproteobacteria bacterium]
MAVIGFLGLGNMGVPMVNNLFKQGHLVKVFDVLPAAMAKLDRIPVTKSESAVEAVKSVDFVITMLPSGAAVEDLYLGSSALLSHISPKALVIDCSTISAESAKLVAAKAAEKKIAMLDAPVSGGIAGAEKGSLTFIVGGERADMEKARPILMSMGQFVLHAGDHGAGQVAKICNNMLLAIHMIGTAEALQLGADHGLDPKVLSDIMLRSSGRNWSLETYNPYPGVMPEVPASKGYQGGFMSKLMDKDLNLAMDAALASETSAPLGALARSLYGLHCKEGNADLDFSSIQKRFKKDSAAS